METAKPKAQNECKFLKRLWRLILPPHNPADEKDHTPWADVIVYLTALVLIGAYSVTDGYIAWIGIPEVPGIQDSVAFAARSISWSLSGVVLLLFTISAIGGAAWVFGEVTRRSQSVRKICYLAVIALAYGVFSRWVSLAAYSDADPKKIFPAGVFSNSEDKSKDLRGYLVWAGQGRQYWFDCNDIDDPKLVGVSDGKISISIDAGVDTARIICSQK